MNAGTLESGIEARTFGKPPSAGAAQIRALPPSERARNVLSKLGTFWGIGLVCVFFPVVHFVLVPLFLVLGIYFAAKISAVRGFVVSGSVPCPGCGQAFVLKPRLAQWPIADVCSACRRDVEILPGAAAPTV